MNKVVLIGRLARDPELRYTTSNVAVCTFTVACDRRIKSENGPSADFISIVAWRNTAEFVSKYFSKGNRIAVTGSIQTRSYDDSNGTKRYVTEVVADDVEFVESKRSDSEAPLPEPPAETGRQQSQNNSSNKPQGGGSPYFALNEDDNCPF